MKLDAHQHFWIYNKEEFSWINDEMKVLRRDFLPEDLNSELEKKGYDGSLAVQASQTEQENIFLLELAEKHRSIKGVVGWVDLQADDVQTKLEKYAENSKLKGVRHIVQSEPDLEFLLRPKFLKGIGLLKNFNLNYDILIFPQHLKVAAEFVSKFPDQKFVLDHLAKPYIKNQKISEWENDLKLLASFPHVHAKISGLVTEASWSSWKKADFKPYLEVALEAFGADRLMIGSDWPVCLVAGTYEEVIDLTEHFISNLSIEEQKKITGENARKFYNLS
ncbi:amidohydrolase family protein [soil metagenome]